MTNGEKIKEIFPNIKIITQYDNPFGDRFMVFRLNNENMQINMEWWNTEYKEPTTECGPKIDKSAMMHEIYMQGVNMAGEYQGCWVRFKEIEKIVDRYVR